MEKQQLVHFAISVIPSFAGDFDHLGPFIDCVNIVKGFTEDKHEELLFLLVKSRIAGPARAFIPKYCHSVEEIITSLEANILPDSPRAIAAKLKAISKDICGEVNVVQFVEHAEDMVDKLVYAYIADEKQLVNQAKSSAINVCAKIFNVIPEVKTVLTPREVIHKYLDTVTSQKPKRNCA